MPILPSEPWLSFLSDINQKLPYRTDLHCCGGFTVTQAYGISRTTRDLDYLRAVPNHSEDLLAEVGGQGSALHKKHGVYLDPVKIITPPDNYQSRLIPLFIGAWSNLRLYALEPHDLVLSKLERHYTRDSEDVGMLELTGRLRVDVLKKRYLEEVRPYLVNLSRHDLTMKIWCKTYFGSDFQSPSD